MAAILGLIAASLTSAPKAVYSPREKAFYADRAMIDFVRPGLVITITSAAISASGVITVNYTLTDPSGYPLDAAGANTPGVISLAYVASYIPKGQEQYVAYTTGSATGAALGTITRPDFELGGTATQTSPGHYQYTFLAQAPAGFDPTATTTVAVDGNRNLTAYNLGTNYAGTTFNFVPNGAAVTVTRDVIRTASCNACHDQLAFHGGYANGMNMCVLCHQPQNQDPVTGNSLDLKVMAHKIHMGASLPSVVGTSTTPGVPYQIAGYMNIITDFSKVVYPADPGDPRRCTTCHSQTTGAAQATAYLTNPTRAACGACHDTTNFATGLNHPGGIQPDDTLCANCHIPKGELDFDASIMGAHVAPTASSLLSGLAVNITGVTNGLAGKSPTVTFTVVDKNKNPVALSALNSISLTMAGPTTDYGYTIFGTNTSTPGYVTESASGATCSAGTCTYTFTNVVPAKATGTYAIGIEARRIDTVPELIGGDTIQTAITYGAPNVVTYFSVDGSPVASRREVVALANCNQCHVNLQIHGSLRNNTVYCVLCHNPSNTDASTRATAVAPYNTQPAQGINFNLLVHRIHYGINQPSNRPYIVIGHGGSVYNSSGNLFPAMSPTGTPTDTENCSLCHVNSTEQSDLSLTGLNAVVDPQGPINPVQPFTSACTGCHMDTATAAHALSNTSTALGEACVVCHGTGGAYAVDQVHAQ